MGKSKIRLLLFAQDGVSKDAYLKELEKLNVHVDVVNSLISFLHVDNNLSPYNGILIDVPTHIRCPDDEKLLINNLVEIYPVARLRFMPSTSEVRMLFFGQMNGSGLTLNNFIEDQCSRFAARVIRINNRANSILNVLASRKPDMSDTHQSVTTNISQGGCFLFGVDEWTIGSDIWISFNELTDKTPIRGLICWWQKWGNSRTFPGIGVKFIEINEGQLQEITNATHKHPPHKNNN